MLKNQYDFRHIRHLNVKKKLDRAQNPGFEDFISNSLGKHSNYNEFKFDNSSTNKKTSETPQ